MTRLSLDEARSARDVARDALKSQTEQVRQDYAARGIGGRVVDAAVEEAKKAASEAKSIAMDSKGIIAGTIGLLGLWAFRRPLIAKAEQLFETIKDKFDDR